MAINQVISNFPPAPDSATDSPQDFNNKANAFVLHQSSTYVTEVNQWATEANQLKNDISSIVATIPDGAIQDGTISSTSAWSSQKIDDTKQNKLAPTANNTILTGHADGSTTFEPNILPVPTVDNTVATGHADGSITFEAGTSGGGKIQQVIQYFKTDTTAVSGSTWTDTDIVATITPSSVDSKIMVTLSACLNSSDYKAYGRLLRDGTVIAIGDASGSRPRVTIASGYGGDYSSDNQTVIFIDSPATTSAVTYKLQIKDFSTGVAYLNRTHADRDTADYEERVVSSLTLMEIGA